MDKIKIFISYSHNDGEYFKEFTKKLNTAVANTEHFTWEVWDDRSIHIGSFWDKEIQKNIEDCNIALLLVSMSFMASRYIKEQEFEIFRKRYAENGILIVPILFAPCDFQRWEDLSKIQFFKPQGSDYGRPEVVHFTFADLITFKPDGTILSNPNTDRYILNLVSKIEYSYKRFSEVEQKKIEEAIAATEILPNEIINKLSDYPKPRTYFTGREEEIADFKSAIDSSITFIAVDGPGGIGKTQFISKCIEQYVPSEKVIWYECTPASHFDTLVSEAGYPDILKGNNKTDREKFSAFKDKIEKGELFLFLDNFQETNHNTVFREFLVFIQDYLKKGCIIVLDRDNLKSHDLTPKRIHIEGFKEKQLEYAKALIEHSYKNEVHISDDELKNLCEELHGYPLIIDLAILLLSQGETSKDIITKIVQQENGKPISERLLNAIFSRPDATDEEKNFIIAFSVFIGRVLENDVIALISSSNIQLTSLRKKLQQKNLLSYIDGYYEIHPLVREFCYEKLQNKVSLHVRVADHYIAQRTEILNSALEEQVFYHLFQSKQWTRIEKDVEENGRKFVLQGQLGLIKELLEKFEKTGITNPTFSILSGDIAVIQGNWDNAQRFYDIASYNTINEEIKIEGIIKYGEMLLRKCLALQALEHFNKAYNLSAESYDKGKARAANDIGLAYEWLGERDKALGYLKESLAIRRKIADDEGIVTSLINMGLSHRKNEDYDEALKYYNESLEKSTRINDIIGISIGFRALGNVYYQKGKYETATYNFKKSLAISEEIGDKRGISEALGGLGNLSINLSQFEKALTRFEESKKIAEEIGDKLSVATNINNIAVVYTAKNRPLDAIKLYKKSLEIKEELHDLYGSAITLGNIGDTYYMHPPFDYQSSIFYHIKSICIYSKINAKLSLASGIQSLFKIRTKIGSQKFKTLVQNACRQITSDMQTHLPLEEILREPLINKEPKIGRNDPCTCGSGKKYKNCHGKPS